MQSIWSTIFYEPLYNALIALISYIPGHDVGLAVILLTVLVKLILFPLTKKSIVSQIKLKRLEPELTAIKEKYTNKEEQAKKTLELYKANKVNPFSGCLVILLQLPIIFALYFVFLKGLDFNADALYSFVRFPEIMHMTFLGLIPMQGKSIVLAVLAGVTQFFQVYLTTKGITPPSGDPKSFSTQLQKSMNMQMKYILPIFIAFIAYKISAAVALYWVTSNVVTIIQELMVRRKMKVKESGVPIVSVI